MAWLPRCPQQRAPAGRPCPLQPASRPRGRRWPAAPLHAPSSPSDTGKELLVSPPVTELRPRHHPVRPRWQQRREGAGHGLWGLAGPRPPSPLLRRHHSGTLAVGPRGQGGAETPRGPPTPAPPTDAPDVAPRLSLWDTAPGSLRPELSRHWERRPRSPRRDRERHPTKVRALLHAGTKSPWTCPPTPHRTRAERGVHPPLLPSPGPNPQTGVLRPGSLSESRA